MSLAEKLTRPPARERVVSDCVSMIDAEVKGKSGFSGIAVKSAYGVVTAVKPRFVGEVVDGLLDDWVAKLEPFYATWKTESGGKSFGDYLVAHRSEAAEALLEVTDGRAKVSKHGTVRKMYEKMRPSAKKHVEEALPRLGALVEKNAAAA